jgi:hypothetical protein
MGCLEAFVVMDQLFTFRGWLQNNHAAVLVRGFPIHEAETFELVEVFAARGRRDTEAPRELPDLEIGFGGDELQEAELRSSETMPADTVKKALLEEFPKQ